VVLLLHNLAHQGVDTPEAFHNLGLPRNAYPVMEWKSRDEESQVIGEDNRGRIGVE
jgi:glycogen synthase